MKITKENFVIFIKQNIKTIFLALICSLFIVGGVYYFFFSGSKTEDYSDANFQHKIIKLILIKIKMIRKNLVKKLLLM